MTALSLNHAEVTWLTDCVGQFAQWPPNKSDEWAHVAIPAERRTENACGPLFRLKLLAALRKGMRAIDPYAADIPVDFSLEELWFLDALLSTFPLRRIRLVDDYFGISLAIKVWDALIAEYAAELPADLLSKPADYSVGVAEEVERFLRATATQDQEDDHE